MHWNPHLSFHGDCRAAFQFYEQCFGGRILTMLTYGETPMAARAPPEWGGKILHATLIAGSSRRVPEIPPPLPRCIIVTGD